MSIYGQVISSSEMVCKGTYSFLVYINSHYYKFSKNKSNNTILSLMKISNGNVNIICYDLKYVVLYSLKSSSQNYFSTLSPPHVPMEEQYSIMDKNNRQEIIEFEKSTSIVNQEITYG